MRARKLSKQEFLAHNFRMCKHCDVNLCVTEFHFSKVYCDQCAPKWEGTSVEQRRRMNAIDVLGAECVDCKASPTSDGGPPNYLFYKKLYIVPKIGVDALPQYEKYRYCIERAEAARELYDVVCTNCHFRRRQVRQP